MANYNLLLDYYEVCPCVDTDGDTSCSGCLCTGRVYASLFNRDNEAMDWDGSPLAVFDTYDKTDDRFRKFMDDAAGRGDERTRYWQALVDCTTLDLPDNPYGEHYEVEFWCEAINGVPDRDADRLLGVRPITWANDREHESRIDVVREENIAQLSALAVYQTAKDAITDATAGSWGKFLSDELMAQVVTQPVGDTTVGDILVHIDDTVTALSAADGGGPQWLSQTMMGYDSETQIVTMTSWLEKDGALQFDLLGLNVMLVDGDGNAVFTVAGTAGEFNNTAGCFFKEVASVQFIPDATYFLITICTDSEGEIHASGSAPVAWD